jgi:hypothetical protein
MLTPGDIRDTAYAGLGESKSMRMLIRNQNRLCRPAESKKHKNFQTNPRGRI